MTMGIKYSLHTLLHAIIKLFANKPFSKLFKALYMHTHMQVTGPHQHSTAKTGQQKRRG